MARLVELIYSITNIRMSQGTVANMLARVTKSVEPIYKGIQQSISEAAAVGSDGTSVKVKGQKDWMWVWQSQSASFISYEQSRGYVSIIKNFPNGFKSSTLVSDALSAQLKTPAQKHQPCVAHMLRELKYFIDKHNSQWCKIRMIPDTFLLNFMPLTKNKGNGKKRIDMRKVRKLLRLHYEQGVDSVRQLSQLCGIGKTTASEYLQAYKRSGLTYSQVTELSDSALQTALKGSEKAENAKYEDLYQRFPHFDQELKKHKMSIKVLWEEYKHGHPDPYEYSQFCTHYYKWRQSSKISMLIDHKAGDKLFVDFTGQKLCDVSSTTGEVVTCEVFVAVLGASQKAYIEAVPTQQKHDFISVNESALHFFGGVPRAIVPDCLKSVVTKANKYESEINETFNDFASHYNTAILPARALHPKDKSLVESFVRQAYDHIYAPLRNQTFFSLEELNAALWEQLDNYNAKHFQNRDYSRQMLFEEVERSALRPLVKERYEI